MYGKEMIEVVFVSFAGLFAVIEYADRSGNMKQSIVPQGFLVHQYGDVYTIDSYYLFGEENDRNQSARSANIQ